MRKRFIRHLRISLRCREAEEDEDDIFFAVCRGEIYIPVESGWALS